MSENKTAPSTSLESLEETQVDARTIFNRTAKYVQRGLDEFPQSQNGSVLFNNDLLGQPFVITSEPVFTHIQGKFGQQEVSRFVLRLLDPDTDGVSEAMQASVSGTYLLNQLRRMTKSELVGSVAFTLSENKRFAKLPNGKHPVMLSVWQAEQASSVPTNAQSFWGDDEWEADERGVAQATSETAPVKRGRGRPPKAR